MLSDIYTAYSETPQVYHVEATREKDPETIGGRGGFTLAASCGVPSTGLDIMLWGLSLPIRAIDMSVLRHSTNVLCMNGARAWGGVHLQGVISIGVFAGLQLAAGQAIQCLIHITWGMQVAGNQFMM